MTPMATRRATEADMPFCLGNWLEMFRESHYAGPVPMSIYRRVYREVIAFVVARANVELWVAYNPEPSPDGVEQLYGFLCIERDVYNKRLRRTLPAVHFVYTKLAFQRTFGVAKALFVAAGVDPRKPFVHAFKTPMSAEIVKAKKLGANWDPLFVRFPRPTATQGAKP